MATGRERRAERLNERLRGAQRTNLGDDSFDLDLGGLNIDGSDATRPPSSVRRSPGTSPGKRMAVDEPSPPVAAAVALSPGSPPQDPTPTQPLPPKDPYDLPDSSKNSLARPTAPESASRDNHEAPSTIKRRAAQSSAARSMVGSHVDTDPVVLPPLPEPAAFHSPSTSRTNRTAVTVDEVEESPANAPGSGKRRSVGISDVMSSSTRLHGALTDSDAPASSSPVAQRVKRRDTAAMRSSLRRSLQSPTIHEEAEEEDELRSSPTAMRAPNADEDDVPEPGPDDEPEEEPEEDNSRPPEQDEAEDREPTPDEDDTAEAVDDAEAARTIGRKRPRRSIQAQSPELGSEQIEQDDEPRAKRARKQPAKSPKTQKQPTIKPRSKPGPATTSSAKPAEATKRGRGRPSLGSRSEGKTAAKAKPKTKRSSVDVGGQSIEITVQRFVNVQKQRRHDNNDGDDDDQDPLQDEMPFAARGETVVDVFAQVCTEVIETTLGQLLEIGTKTEDRAKQKECRIKMRAIEAYKEELNSRLLQHAIHLNDWHTLRRQVRMIQKEKLSLRDEILRLKAEREQVALQMDAVRIKHEKDSNEAKYRLDTSTMMHNIELAVEQGRSAPPGLSPAQEKRAELANLELLVSRIADEASSNSTSGGLLTQVREFNALLERAAVALESR